MPYRLRTASDLASEIRRCAAEQASRAQATLAAGIAHGAGDVDLTAEDPWDEAVHDVRKRAKKIRAVARLCRDALGEGYRPANDTFRDVARLLSAQRDAWTLVETADTLREQDASTLPDADSIQHIDEVHHALVDRYADIRAAAGDDDLLRTVEVALRDATATITGWPLPDDLTPSDLAQSIHRVHSRGRRGWEDLHDTLGEDPDASGEAWHDWRKRVKYLWYQVRLLEDAWPGPMQALADELDELADLLGDDHDLMVLGDVLTDEGLVAPAVAEQVAGTAAARRHTLRRDAMALARRIYAEDSDAFTGRLVDYLEAPGS